MYNEADQWPREEPMYYNSRPKDSKNNGYNMIKIIEKLISLVHQLLFQLAERLVGRLNPEGS